MKENLSVMWDGSEQIHYQNPEIPLYINYGNLREMPNMTALCHWHEEVELLLPIWGYLSYNVNGRQMIIEEGNAIFVNSRQMHYGFTTDGTDCEYVCICFRPNLVGYHKYFYEQYVTPILDNSALNCLLIEKGVSGHDEILKLIRDIADYKNRDLILMGKIFELWQRIYDVLELKHTAVTDKNAQALKQMLVFIRNRYMNRISLEQIASAGGVCRSKCCQIFKKYVGQSPNAYVTEYRLERSMELLRESSLNITEVAAACGFNSSSYFTEVFLREKGRTPTGYRQKYRKTS